MSRLTLCASMAGAAMLAWGMSGIALEEGGLARAEAASRAPAPPPAASLATPDGPQQGKYDGLVVAGAGESLAELLLRAGVGGLDSMQAAMALPAEDLQPGQRVRLWLGGPLPGGARALERMEVRSSKRHVQVLERRGEGFVVRTTERHLDDTPVRFRLPVGPDLRDELATAGLTSAMQAQVLGATEGATGTLDLIVAHEQDGSSSSYGPFLYLSVTGPAGEVRRWLGDGSGRLAALQQQEHGLVRPVEGPVSSEPGLRLHPVLRFLRWHRGTDFAAPHGTPVRAVSSGEVIEAGWRGGYGKVIRLRHADGTTSAYAHLSDFSVHAGDRVRQGEEIGKVGTTGLTTGPHLHFELARHGETIRPVFRPSPSLSLTIDERSRGRVQALLSAPFRLPPVQRS